MTWPELDSLFVGQETSRQKDLVGHRITAVKVHNTGYEEPITPRQLLFLPYVDGVDQEGRRAAKRAVKDKKDTVLWYAKRKAEFGDRFPWTPKTEEEHTALAAAIQARKEAEAAGAPMKGFFSEFDSAFAQKPLGVLLNEAEEHNKKVLAERAAAAAE